MSQLAYCWIIFNNSWPNELSFVFIFYCILADNYGNSGEYEQDNIKSQFWDSLYIAQEKWLNLEKSFVCLSVSLQADFVNITAELHLSSVCNYTEDWCSLTNSMFQVSKVLNVDQIIEHKVYFPVYSLMDFSKCDLLLKQELWSTRNQSATYWKHFSSGEYSDILYRAAAKCCGNVGCCFEKKSTNFFE